MKSNSPPLESRPKVTGRPVPQLSARTRPSLFSPGRIQGRDTTVPSTLRIWIVSTLHQPDDVRIFWKQAVSLAAAGYEVTALFWTSDPASAREEEVAGVHRVILWKGHPASGLRGHVLLLGQALRLCLASNCQNFILHDPELIPAGIILERFGRLVIYDAHEDLPTQTLHKSYLARWQRPIAQACAQALCLSAGRGLHGTLCATNTIQRRFPKNSCLVRNFPLHEEFDDLAPDRRGNRIAYLGGLTRARGVLELVQAVNLLETPAFLTLAGTWESDVYRSECERADRHGRVTYLGHLSRKGVINVLAGCDLGVVVLRPVPAYLDALPVKLFEYMAAGIPVIASDFPLWRGIVGGAGCGVLVEPGDVNSLRVALAYLLENPGIRAQMGANGRSAVQQRYTWEAESVSLLNFVKSIFGEPALTNPSEEIALPS